MVVIRWRAWVGAAVLIAAVALIGRAPGGANQHAGESDPDGALIVRLKDGAAESGVMQTLTASGPGVTGRLDQLQMIMVQPTPGDSIGLRQRLAALAAVRYAAVDLLQTFTAAPNDPNSARGDQWNLERI